MEIDYEYFFIILLSGIIREGFFSSWFFLILFIDDLVLKNNDYVEFK